MPKLNLKEDWVAMLLILILSIIIIVSWIPPYDYESVGKALVRFLSSIAFVGGSIIYLFTWFIKKSE